MPSIDAFLKALNKTNSSVDADPELIKDIQESVIGPEYRLMTHMNEQFGDFSGDMERHIKALEDIANTAKLQADHALEELLISQERLNLYKEEVETLESIARDAKSQADTALKELELTKEKLRLTKAEAADANKDARRAEVLAWIAIIISVIELILPYVSG